MSNKPRTKSHRVQKDRCYFDVYKAALAYLRDTRGSLHEKHYSLILGLIRAREYAKLAEIRTRLDSEYLESFPNQVLFQIEAFFKKNSEFSEESRCIIAAKDSFFEAERQCEHTNVRLFNFYMHESYISEKSIYKELYRDICKMRLVISKLLGSHETFISRLPELCKVSSGATSTRNRRLSTPYHKVRKRVAVTPRAFPYLNAISAFVGYKPDENSFGKIVNCNRVTVVPKSWKTHRTIACEPEGNSFLQLAFDTYMKKRFDHIDNSLSDQTRNQLLAKDGSISNHLATVDLSSASDTLSSGLVDFLLPFDWASMLHDFATPFYKGVFGIGKYSKFSSMGNGTTFPLETLVFYAAAKATESTTVSVYGDDIVIDSTCFERLEELLHFLGFDTNKDKTFHRGPFRESCGADYFKGVNIRPFFLRKTGSIGKSQLCHVVNGLVAISDNAGGLLHDYCYSLVKKYHLPIVPVNENTTSGVFVPAHTAYALNKVRQVGPKGSTWPQFRGYTTVERSRIRGNAKSLILWFLTKLRNPAEVSETSVVGTNINIVRYGTIRWQIPQQKPALPLYLWGEYFTRRKPLV